MLFYFCSMPSLRVPTLRQLVALYQSVAADMATFSSGFPSSRTVKNNVNYFSRFVRFCGLSWDSPLSALTKPVFERYFLALSRFCKPITAYFYLIGLRGVTARWALSRYSRLGYDVRPFDLPSVRKVRGPRYFRPDDGIVQQVKAFYRELFSMPDKRFYLFFLLVFEFAMRNSDVRRCCSSFFVHTSAGHSLSYCPQKVRFANRRVFWPIHPDIWKRISPFVPVADPSRPLIGHFTYVERRLSSLLRSRVPSFCGSRSIYNLRKLRIDAEYRFFGIERAIALSGDDYVTIQRYYADVANLDIEPLAFPPI